MNKTNTTRGRLSLPTLPDFLAFHRIMQGIKIGQAHKETGLNVSGHELGSLDMTLYSLFDYFNYYGMDFADWAQLQRIHWPSDADEHTEDWASDVNRRLKLLDENPFPRGYPRTTTASWKDFVLYHRLQSGLEVSQLVARGRVCRRHFEPGFLERRKNFSVKSFLGTLYALDKTVFDWITWEKPEEEIIVKPQRGKRPKKDKQTKPAKDHPWRLANERSYQEVQRRKRGTQTAS